MKVLAIHGNLTDDEREAVEEAIEVWWVHRECCSKQLLVRLPTTRTVVDVQSSINEEQHGTVIIEGGMVTFIPTEGRPV